VPSLSIVAFLVSAESVTSVLMFPSPSRLRNTRRFCLPGYLFPLDELFQLLAQLIPLRPHFSHASDGSTGISTCCPSPTPSGLGLGPDLPWADEPSPGILRFSTVKILTLLALLIPAFSLLSRPHVLPVVLHPNIVSSPTTAFRQSVASVHSFSPGNFRRRLTRLVSYYALFE
jgi:hypothetical protein